MRKIEYWEEVDELGRTWMGNYSDVHERMGNWMLALKKEPYYRFYRFENGKIIGIWSPDKEDIEANIAWLCQDKKFCISPDQRGIWVLDNSKGVCGESALVFDREHQMQFYASPSKAKVETTTITIAVSDEQSDPADQYVDQLPQEYENIFQGRKSGGGKWNLSDKNELEITFNDGYTLRFTIDYFSENLIGLKYIR